jgi:hypothetical protein
LRENNRGFKKSKMDPLAYSYPSPLAGYEGLPPLPDEKAEDGKSECSPNATAFLIS